MIRRSYLALLTLSLASCATYSQEEGDKLANEVYALSTQLQAIQKSLRVTQDRDEKQAEKIDSMSTEVESFSRAAKRNDADLGVKVEDVLQQLAQMKGLVEVTRERTDDIEQKINRLQEESKVATAANEDEKRKAIEAAQARERLLSNPKSAIEEAQAAISAKKADSARSILQEFLLRAKTNKAFELMADEAQYLMGESFFIEAKYSRGATEYNAVRKTYPNSKKVAEALYKMGLCFERLKLNDDAKLFYRTVIKQFPRSQSAKEAKDRLTELRD